MQFLLYLFFSDYIPIIRKSLTISFRKNIQFLILQALYICPALACQWYYPNQWDYYHGLNYRGEKTCAISESQLVKLFFLYKNSISQLLKEKTIVRKNEKIHLFFSNRSITKVSRLYQGSWCGTEHKIKWKKELRETKKEKVSLGGIHRAAEIPYDKLPEEEVEILKEMLIFQKLK